MANPENKQIPYESTQKDIRDAIESVATAIGGITHPDAEDIVYDNSVSGLSATDVQNALDEIVSDIPTVNDGTLTIQQNGEAKGTFTANQSGNSTVNIETPTTDIQTAVDEFETYNGGLLSECKVALSPNQDLHGYDSPWVGGAGKNKLPLTVDNIKALNGGASSWNGNSKVIKGVTFTLNTDNNGNLISITTSGTATGGNANVDLVRNFTVSASVLSGTPSGSTGNDYYIRCGIDGKYYTDMGNGVAINGTITSIWIGVANGVTAPSNPWLPMIESGSEKTAYEPYENICPISGHTQVEVDVSDGQTTQEQITVTLGGTYYSGTLDVVSGELTVDSAFIASYNGETLPSTWISDRDVYAVGTTPTTGAEVCYKLATPQTIQLTPQQVKALVGENHLSAPLEGQEITESKYKQMFTFDDVIAYIQSLS